MLLPSLLESTSGEFKFVGAYTQEEIDSYDLADMGELLNEVSQCDGATAVEVEIPGWGLFTGVVMWVGDHPEGAFEPGALGPALAPLFSKGGEEE